MPIKFIPTPQLYKINYSALYDEFNTLKIFPTPSIQTAYLSQWFSHLKKLDEILLNQFKTPSDQLRLMALLSNESQIFQQSIHLSQADIFIHYRISHLLELLEQDSTKMDQHTIEFPLSAFTEKDSTIIWTPVKKNLSPAKNNQKPIIMTTFCSKQQRWLVLDGNHRITYATQSNQDTIRVLQIHPRMLTDSKLFMSGFDEALYALINEVPAIAFALKTKKATEQELLQLSFLNTKILKPLEEWEHGLCISQIPHP